MIRLKYIVKYSILVKLTPVIGIVLLLKLLVHKFGLEVIELNALFTSLVAGTVFLVGFLISGVLSDYKEAEKLPAELAASLETLYDDTYTLIQAHDSKAAPKLLTYYKAYVSQIHNWLYGKAHAQELLSMTSGLNDHFVSLEKEDIQPSLLIRMKNEQSQQRKLLLRMHTIRDTSFVPSAYAIVEILAVVLGFWMIAMKITPFYDALFFTAIVTFLFGYLLLLIRDLDNPFEYPNKGGAEVSLKPLLDLEKKLK